MRSKIAAVRVEIPLADFNALDSTSFLSQGNHPSLWTGAVSPPGVNERSDSGDHVRRRLQRDCSRGTDLFGVLTPAEVEEQSDVYSTGATSVFVRRRLRHQAEERSDVYPFGAATD